MKNIFFVLSTALIASMAFSAKLASKTDGEWITYSGKVTATSADSFKLNTNGKSITVEMDDFDWDADGYKLKKNDQVVLTGKVDINLLSKNTVEASSVYVKSIDSFFFANPADEEGDAAYIDTSYVFYPTLKDGAYAELQGTVKSVGVNEFKVDTGLRSIRVETDKLRYNPLDNKGVVQVDLGDRVRVTGVVDDDFIEGKELVANSVFEL